jgi:hypothetical protein
MSETIFTLIGVIIGSIVTWRSALCAADRQAFNAAGASLRAVFASIQSRIRNEKIAEWNDFRTEMQNLFDTHAIEFEKFRFHVSKGQITEYDAACRNYRNIVHNRSITASTTPRNGTPDSRSETERFLDALDPILAFTKPKNDHYLCKYLVKFVTAICNRE